jgi:predicted metal-binding membrane protein
MATMSGDGVIAEFAALMMQPAPAGPYLGATVLMWVIMMIAMMTPAVIPMAVVYRGMNRGRAVNLATLLFGSGYLAGWSAFSIAAGGLQWILHSAGILRGMSLAASAQVAGGLLIAAGTYQFTPLKEACLSHCRSPFGYFMGHWRDGLGGAFTMGFGHGLFCIGCCWALMLLMFAGGAMSVLTMAALSGFILAERLLPAGPWAARIPGVALVVAGVVVAARSVA